MLAALRGPRGLRARACPGRGGTRMTDLRVRTAVGGRTAADTSTARSLARTLRQATLGNRGAGSEGPRVAMGTALPRGLEAWLGTLRTEAAALRARGALPEGYTWSSIANPLIWAAASPQGLGQLRAALDSVRVEHRAADLMAAWWERQQVRSVEDAAAWLTDRARAMAGLRRPAGTPELRP